MLSFHCDPQLEADLHKNFNVVYIVSKITKLVSIVMSDIAIVLGPPEREPQEPEPCLPEVQAQTYIVPSSPTGTT